MARRRPHEPKQRRGKYDRTLSATARRAEQRLRLLQAAAHVFAHRGFARATVDAIVARARVSRTTFYEFFDDLPDALVKLHEHATSFAFRFVEDAVRAQPDGLSKMRAGVEAFLGVLALDENMARVVFREARTAGPVHAVLQQAVIARFAALMSENVAEAHAQRAVKRPPDELTVFALVSAIEAVGLRYLERGEPARAADAAPALFELLVRAFR